MYMQYMYKVPPTKQQVELKASIRARRLHQILGRPLTLHAGISNRSGCDDGIPEKSRDTLKYYRHVYQVTFLSRTLDRQPPTVHRTTTHPTHPPTLPTPTPTRPTHPPSTPPAILAYIYGHLTNYDFTSDTNSPIRETEQEDHRLVNAIRGSIHALHSRKFGTFPPFRFSKFDGGPLCYRRSQREPANKIHTYLPYRV
ncbi:hypothetical protein EVAR_58735_1 [Eumeta japonica]|uniref:Uncharacterized protein n=1 Tax=Eumeta variegata TaxID=151549 RepID=A0A4C1YXD7_EUMVA|nr:hypothetical protein EVAR_58735_1 [Eumeta japonica]